MNNTKEASLKKAFKAYLDGKRSVSTIHEARIFFEAARIQSSPSECLEHIISSKAGLKGVRQSVRISLDKEYVRQSVLPFLFFFADDEAMTMFDGTFLHQFVLVIVNPPTAWNNITRIYREDTNLHGEAESGMFAWLCYQIILHPDPDLSDVVEDIEELLKERPLLDLPWEKTRNLAYQIQKALDTRKDPGSVTDGAFGQDGPGGRHDNDFKDFREIAIYPTPDELASTTPQFLRTAREVEETVPDHRAACHLDNQFRLYRADFLAELKEGIAGVFDPKQQGGRPCEILRGFACAQVAAERTKRISAYSLNVSFNSGLSFPPKLDEAGRRKHLLENRNILGHQNLGFFFHDKKIVAFAFVVRNVDNLIHTPPIITLRFVSAQDLVNGSQAVMTKPELCFAVVDTSWFAYEPVLERLKQIRDIPMQDDLLMLGHIPNPESQSFQPTEYIADFVAVCREKAAKNQEILIVDKSYILDVAQANALTYALESPLSVIQGPPGTGKSFIGALIVKLLLQSKSSRILVITYTNHSTNQMLEDLLEIGISPGVMTRLGSKQKASSKTADMCIESQFNARGSRLKRDQWVRQNDLKAEILEFRSQLDVALERLGWKVSLAEILSFLELDDDQQSNMAWAAFQPPTPSIDDGFRTMGKAGRVLQPEEMLTRWQQGQKCGAAMQYLSPESKKVWEIPPPDRIKLAAQWRGAVQKERVEAVTSLASVVEQLQKEVDIIFNNGRHEFAASRRVIGCTTTAAAMQMALLKAFKPTCILVEEAGEILEPHILAALCPSTEQLVLIGDHKQLRPKCNSYALSVENGDGYDLNRSIFERLIMQGHRHETLQRQHRMVPEISQFVRSLTYPELLDSDKTHNRPVIRGLCSRVVFVNHSMPEEGVSQIKDQRDAGSKGSRQNAFEADMVLKIVKYLGQQGYNTSNIVVLTPYLGQLRLLRDMLSKENDPVLNDLDSAELIRANLLSKAAAKVNGAKIKLSSIDNYQGEESDIVVASLTRSNKHGDIGFMKAAERLNVLISRARNCLVMIGNMETFMKAKNGQETWRPFFNLLKDNEFLHDGLLVRCERHPERTAMLSTPKDFAEKCPDGGCTEDCKATLSCGKHSCRRKCHLLSDHSMVSCDELLKFECGKGHHFKLKCSEKIKKCPKCTEEEEDLRRRLKRDLELEKARQARQDKYRKELQDIKDEIARHQRQAEIEKEEKDELDSLDTHRRQLESLRLAKERNDSEKNSADNSAMNQNGGSADTAAGGPDKSSDQSSQHTKSPAQAEWGVMKREEFAKSKDLDALMSMIGLEGVKRTFLDIKSQIDIATQQNVSLKDDRFGCTLLGNPGTGKTTVARIYANFLTSMGVLPGSSFEETTGSKLANMGVNGCQKLVDKVLSSGGGVIFIDEAYQLSSGNSSGGSAVLDFLLAEVENLRSRIVFILAGYSKQMESFFAHNPGFSSRFPLEMKFDDYSDEELLDILAYQVQRRFKGRLKVEDGLNGLYCRIVSRRVGRGRGKDGFGNARAIENALMRIYRNQARRITAEKQMRKKKGSQPIPKPDPLCLTKLDIIGPKPSQALLQSKAWKSLQELIGLKSVKESVQVLVDTLESNYERELAEKPIVQYNLNRVFLGNPGTGKTTVAKLYGEILAQIGVLSIGEVVVKSPADFVGDVIGSTEKLTKGILDSTVGKVLVIDEAYSFYGGGGRGQHSGTDIFKVAAIDTIVANVHSTPGDDRCVLLLGYRAQMEDMLKNMNPGLTRRFPIQSGFVFEDFDPAQLETIFRLKLKKQGFSVTPKAQEVALQMLERARNLSNFGNAGEIDNLLDLAKARHQKRVSTGKTKRKETLEGLDFDEKYDRGAQADASQLFEGTVGCEKIVKLLQSYQATVRAMSSLRMNPRESIPFNFLFRGPPGTGKTSTARKMGKVFYDAGILGSDEVVEVSTSDIIGQYIGHTGPKVRDALDKGLGKVLFIDEAYRLAPTGSGGGFAREALDEIVDACTKERYHKKLVIILAGYENDINHLLTANSGLSSRFSEVLDFHALSPSACLELMVKELTKKRKEVEDSGSGNNMSIDSLSNPAFRSKLEDYYFARACRLQSWASARDVLTLVTSIFNNAIRASSSGVVDVSEAIVESEIESFIKEKESRIKSARRMSHQSEASTLPMQSPPPPQTSSTTAGKGTSSKADDSNEPDQQKSDEESDPRAPTPELSGTNDGAPRDKGVSDEVWDELQEDIKKEKKREEEYQAKLQAAKHATDEMRRRIVKELLQKEKETKIKQKLHERGVCPMGYQWIRQAKGWRCAGGSHFMGDEAASQL